MENREGEPNLIYQAGTYEVAVIGAGHAGIEAALASARLGCETVVFTINMDAVGNCPCNPSIGGTANGYLVREIDALGGETVSYTHLYSSAGIPTIENSLGPQVIAVIFFSSEEIHT